MIQILCCDDNTLYLEKLQELIQTLSLKHQINCKVFSFESGESLVFFLREQVNFADIIFLDILMAKKNGIDTANELRNLGCKSEIIFVTSSRDFVFNSFDSQPLNYLIKNNTKIEKFEEVFMQAIKLSKDKQHNSFLFETNGQTFKLSLSKIMYFEVSNRIVTIFTDEGVHCFYGKIDDIETTLAKKNFFRTHRSMIVNLSYILKFSSQDISLTSGDRLPVGSKYYKAFKDSFSKYLHSDLSSGGNQ